MFGNHRPTSRDVFKNLAFIVVAIGAAYFVTVYIGIERVRETVYEAGIFGPLIIILLKTTTIVVVPLGGTPLYPIAGAIFGFWKGLGITLIGDAVGSTIAFYLSRFYGRSILHFLMSRQYLTIVEKLIEKSSNTATFLKARLFFAGFPELFAYAAGLTKISFPIFIVAQIGVHSISASLLVIFGDLLVSGNLKAILIAGGISTLLAFIGVWWFHADMTRGS